MLVFETLQAIPAQGWHGAITLFKILFEDFFPTRSVTKKAYSAVPAPDKTPRRYYRIHLKGCYTANEEPTAAEWSPDSCISKDTSKLLGSLGMTATTLPLGPHGAFDAGTFHHRTCRPSQTVPTPGQFITGVYTPPPPRHLTASCYEMVKSLIAGSLTPVLMSNKNTPRTCFRIPGVKSVTASKMLHQEKGQWVIYLGDDNDIGGDEGDMSEGDLPASSVLLYLAALDEDFPTNPSGMRTWTGDIRYKMKRLGTILSALFKECPSNTAQPR
ncbi:hypothetical protein J6590_077570 [Homalodisca vitripennis]|nr:hypothetical protein J6590_077570 [Homalodisca vitripennis]